MLGNTLSKILLSTQEDSVITDDGMTVANLKDDVARARESIKEIKNREIALFHSDAYVFLVWLLAAWQENRKLLVPVDMSIASDPDFSGWFKIGEFDSPDIKHWESNFTGLNREFKGLERDFDAIGVFTSGSTGAPVMISKRIWQLENEVEAMEFTFGKAISKHAIFNRSVSHQHFFGMPFGLFWAVSRGSIISRLAIKGPHEWSTLAPQVLITSPSFLKSVSDTTSQHKNIGPNIESIFCAGGILEGETFSRINEITQTRVVDIYGSSETGHIAWRTLPGAPWQVQSGVEFKKPIESVLEIKSKFCPEYDWFATSDLASQIGDSFEILGRADRIIKIEGTRVSLSQLIEAISSSKFVEDCMISDLGNGRRSQVGAVLRLTNLGVAEIEANGKLALVNQIKGSLKGRVNSISIPRRWRFIDRFPQNNMGKVVKKELDHLFAGELKTPIVVHRNLQGSSLELALDMAKSLHCFSGHFDGFPVVPGVALVEWAIKYSQNELLKNHAFVGMSQIKFLKFIKPNQIVRLKLNFDLATLNLKFQYFDAQTIYSSGILKFGDQEA